eukprot:s679_g29.t3
MLAVCQGARAVILESAVVQIIVRCVERTKQLRAKQADDKWHTLGDSRSGRSLFGGQLGIEAKRISEALGEMLAGFEGDDDVRSRFLNVAKSFDQSEVSLRQLQQSFGDNLDGLEAMRNNFDRCTEEVIRLVSLLEGDCASMRLQLHRTLKSPRERMSQNLFGGIESLGKSRLVLENIPSSPEDHISGLLDTLEHDLCDTPLTHMVQVAQDVNDHIVRQLSEKGRLEKLRPCRLSFDATAQGLQWVSPARIIEEMFQTLKPCIFESANAMAEVDTVDAGTDGTELDVSAEQETAALIASGGLMSPTRPPVDLSFARAQLSKVPNSKPSSKDSNPPNRRKGSRQSVPRTSVTGTGSSGTGSAGLGDFKRPEVRRPSGHDAKAELSDPLSGPLRQSRGQRSLNSDSSVPLSVSASSPDLPGLVRKDLRPKAVGSLGLANSSQSASATEFRDQLKHVSAEGRDGRVGSSLGVGVGSPSLGDFPLDPLAPPSVGHAVGHRDVSELHGKERQADAQDAQDGRKHADYGVRDELAGTSGQLDPPELGRAQVRSADALLGRSSGHSDLQPWPPQPGQPRQPGLGHSEVEGQLHLHHEAGPADPAGPRLLGTETGKQQVLLGNKANQGNQGNDGHPLPEVSAPHGPMEQDVQPLPPGLEMNGVNGVRLGEPRRSRIRKSSEPELADYSRFMAPGQRAGYEQQMTANPFMGSPLLVTKSKLEERPRRQSLTDSESLFPRPLEPRQPLRSKPGLPAPMGLAGMALSGTALPPAPTGNMSRQGRATSSPMVGTMRGRPASLDRYRLNKGTSGLLPTLKPLDGQAIVGHAQLRKASPACSIGSASDGHHSDHEMLRLQMLIVRRLALKKATCRSTMDILGDKAKGEEQIASMFYATCIANSAFQRVLRPRCFAQKQWFGGAAGVLKPPNSKKTSLRCTKKRALEP